MAEVFISYRRQAALKDARALYERLRSDLGQQQVFIDLEGIEVGVDFVDLIEEQLRGCRVLLALIEPDWAAAKDRQGRRRLDLSNDYVRVEIATALRRGIRVMPILIDGAEMPDPDTLPDDLKPLARLNAQLLDFQRFDAEVGRLVAAIRRVLASPVLGSGVHGGDRDGGAQRSDAAPAPEASSPLASGSKPPEPKPEPVEAGEPVSQPPRQPQHPPPPAAPAPAAPAFAQTVAAVEAAGTGGPASSTSPFGKPWFWISAAAGVAVVVALASGTRRSPAAPAPAQAVSVAPAVSEASAPVVAPAGTPAAMKAPPSSKPTPEASVAPAVAKASALAPASAATSVPAKPFRDCDVCPEMVPIPAGSFMMGSPPNEPERGDDEGPQRRVTVNAFAMGRTEVTQRQWMALMGSNRSGFEDCGGDCPVEKVSWNDAQEYVRRLSAKTGQTYRLPSEAQWEYAARAGTTTPFYTGETIAPAQANFDGSFTYNGSAKGEDRQKTVKVGSFAPNAFGLYDMLGNVREWVQDCYDAQAYRGKAPNDGTAYEPSGCTSRVLRGGSWSSGPGNLRAGYRYVDPPPGLPLRLHRLPCVSCFPHLKSCLPAPLVAGSPAGCSLMAPRSGAKKFLLDG